MISQIFAAIQLVLKLIGLWDQFMDWSDKKRIADAEERKQKRDRAVDDQANAKDEKEFDDDQKTVVDNLPRP